MKFKLGQIVRMRPEGISNLCLLHPTEDLHLCSANRESWDLGRTALFSLCPLSLDGLNRD